MNKKCFLVFFALFCLLCSTNISHGLPQLKPNEAKFLSGKPGDKGTIVFDLENLQKGEDQIEITIEGFKENNGNLLTFSNPSPKFFNPPPLILLKPEQTMRLEIPYEIPPEAKPGGHPIALIFSSMEKAKDYLSDGTVMLMDPRIGVKAFVTVVGGRTDVQVKKLNCPDNTKVCLQLENVGDCFAEPAPQVVIKNENRTRIGAYFPKIKGKDSNKDWLLPGQTFIYEQILPKPLLPGKYYLSLLGKVNYPAGKTTEVLKYPEVVTKNLPEKEVMIEIAASEAPNWKEKALECSPRGFTESLVSDGTVLEEMEITNNSQFSYPVTLETKEDWISIGKIGTRSATFDLLGGEKRKCNILLCNPASNKGVGVLNGEIKVSPIGLNEIVIPVKLERKMK